MQPGGGRAGGGGGGRKLYPPPPYAVNQRPGGSADWHGLWYGGLHAPQVWPPLSPGMSSRITHLLVVPRLLVQLTKIVEHIGVLAVDLQRKGEQLQGPGEAVCVQTGSCCCKREASASSSQAQPLLPRCPTGPTNPRPQQRAALPIVPLIIRHTGQSHHPTITDVVERREGTEQGGGGGPVLTTKSNTGSSIFKNFSNSSTALLGGGWGQRQGLRKPKQYRQTYAAVLQMCTQSTPPEARTPTHTHTHMHAGDAIVRHRDSHRGALSRSHGTQAHHKGGKELEVR